MTPFLSAALIIKNESKLIARCLSTFLNHVDEVVIVDTGSTDNTKEIILDLAKVHSHIRLYDFEWIDDFSAARNFAISKTKGEWIFMPDADDFLHPDDGPKIKEVCKLLEGHGHKEAVVDVTLTQVIDNQITGTMYEGIIKIFSRNLYFTEAIHEYLVADHGRPLARYTSDIRIYHDGYDPNLTDTVAKKKRNITLLERGMKNDPTNGHNFMYFAREIRKINPELSLKFLLQAEQLFGESITNGQRMIIDLTRKELLGG